MNWLKLRLRAWINSAQDEPDMPETLSSNRGSIAKVRVSDAFEGDGGLTIRVHRANGGRIVSFNHYDRKTDRNYSSVYIVPEELDFERELGRMITLESMRG